MVSLIENPISSEVKPSAELAWEGSGRHGNTSPKNGSDVPRFFSEWKIDVWWFIYVYLYVYLCLLYLYFFLYVYLCSYFFWRKSLEVSVCDWTFCDLVTGKIERSDGTDGRPELLMLTCLLLLVIWHFGRRQPTAVGSKLWTELGPTKPQLGDKIHFQSKALGLLGL